MFLLIDLKSTLHVSTLKDSSSGVLVSCNFTQQGANNRNKCNQVACCPDTYADSEVHFIAYECLQ
jgi:hypothetical protein